MAFFQRTYSHGLSPIARAAASQRIKQGSSRSLTFAVNNNRFFSSSSSGDDSNTVEQAGNETLSIDALSPNDAVLTDAVALVDPVTSSLGYYPSDLVIRTVTAVHEASGLDWWLSIVGVTIALRTFMLPITIDSIKNTHRVQLARPELEQLSLHYRENPAETVEEQMEMRNKMKAVQDKHGAKMYKMFVPLLVQMPIFVSFFFGLRRMSEDFPSFQNGGALWFTDLTVPDPSYMLPVIAGASFLTTIELGGETGETEQTKKMKNVFRFMAVAMVPLTMNQPQGVFVYWVTSNAFTLAQTLVMKIPPVRATLGMPMNSSATLAQASTAAQGTESSTLLNAPPTKPAGNSPSSASTRSTRRSRRKNLVSKK